ncbi:DnaJ domain-containing protein [Nocardioides sp. KC13]|uniref:DnaJ domain-containing protein n=1 Tax=Nocardioides turkmenicus TaxID=2711220 RepID=A0A6M1RAE3_9ACTN|nr:DnaJ domain-containing protein [Nocardioides sp. KC13]
MSGKFIDAYSVLQIGPDADDAAVRARHRELAKQFHPDRGGRAADGELMMRINRARDVLLDPVARATLDEELARRRRTAAPAEPKDAKPDTAPGSPPLSRDRRWRAEWGSRAPWTAPPAGSSSPGPVPPPPARVRPSASRLRQATRQARAANPALSARLRPAAPKPPRPQPTVQPAENPQAASPRPATPPPANPQPVTPPPAAAAPKKPTSAWSLYAVPLDGVSVASLIASVLLCGPLGFILGIIGLARTADDKRRGRWAAVAGIAISTLTMLVVIGYVMQAMSAPAP